MPINLDEDGYIDESFYLNASISIIQRNLQDRGIDPSRVTTNQLMSGFNQCYDSLFRPPHKPISGCTIPYNTTNIERLIRVYLSICDTYDALPSVYSFGRYCGIEDGVLDRYVTFGKSIITKHRKNYVQEKLGESTVGIIALANNDVDTNLLYTRQNIVAQATVKKALSFADLRQIAENGSNNSETGEIVDNG